MKTQYITDTTGKKTGVILSIRDYEKIMEELEELEDIKAYDRAKTLKSEPIPFEQAVKEIELLRKYKLFIERTVYKQLKNIPEKEFSNKKSQELSSKGNI